MGEGGRLERTKGSAGLLSLSLLYGGGGGGYRLLELAAPASMVGPALAVIVIVCVTCIPITWLPDRGATETKQKRKKKATQQRSNIK